MASQSAGAIYKCNITFKDNSIVEFINNSAGSSGGALVINQDSKISMEGNTTVTFHNNTADYGAVFHVTNSTITFTDSSTVLFYNNIAQRKGGAGYLLNSKVVFKGYAMVQFDNNIAEQNAGALYSAQSYISFMANTSIILTCNTAIYGGALYFDSNSEVTFSQFSSLKFYFNRAFYGGAIIVNDHSSIIITRNSSLLFVNNSADQYGSAIFLDMTAVVINKCSNKNCITFKGNLAKVLGDYLYQNIEQQCNDRVVGISHELMATPPKELNFNYPAICINKDNTQCNYYYIQNIMIGTEIIIPACVFDCYNHLVDSTQFLLQSQMHSNYSISGPKQVLISMHLKGLASWVIRV